MRTWKAMLGLVVVGGLVACGGGQEGEGNMEADTTAAMETTTTTAGLTMPGWMVVDASGQTVQLDIQAGSDPVNNYWNFNGLYAGSGAITVPAGYTVTINFHNADPAQPHSVGIHEKMDTYPAMFESTEPAFAGAISSNPTTGTAPGQAETITFTTGNAGEYAMVCYVPGHAVAGMVVPFHVSADGSAGVSQ